MFYSHTFLARKGPLGTVWCAAHLQHKLRKSQYISTNVPSTVDRILFPQVPIALRMSGHLLLGIVRIYSKQVDYLYNDCKEISITINRVFNTVNVNLPQDALYAPLHSVTLPGLDGLNLDDYLKNLGEDSHLKSLNEITLSDHDPTEKDQYFITSFDRDLRGSLLTEDDSETWAAPMDEDVHPQAELNTPPLLKYPSSSYQAGPVNSNVGNITPQNLSSVEAMRNATHSNVGNITHKKLTILPDRASPDRSLEEQINKHNETPTLPMEEIVMSPNGNVGNSTPQKMSPNGNDGNSTPEKLLSFDFSNLPKLPDQAPPDRVLEEQINKDNENATLPIQEITMSPESHFPSSHGHEEHQHLNSPSPFDHPMPEMVIPQSPPNAVQPKVRFQCDDGPIVLKNRRMKRWLNDTSNITRKRGNCPSSSFDVWRVNKRLRKEDAVFDLYINGACAALEAIHSYDIIKSAKFQLAPNQEANQEANQDVHQEAHQEANQEAHQEANQEANQERNVAQSPKDIDTTIEYLRNKDYASPERDIPPSVMKGALSSVGTSYHTPENSNLDLQSGQMETTGNTDGLLPTTDAGSSGYHDLGMETPYTFYDGSSQGEHTALSVIPELDTSAGDLEFLEQDVNSAAGPDGTPELRALSSRTRAAAQYLKRQSSVTPISENAGDSSEVLSLNKILEGKQRKICARMFYETLVLKSHGLINVRQETPYGDITLKVTSKLSKGKFVE